MHDAERVRFRDCLARLQHEVHCLRDGQATVLPEPRREVQPLQVLHDHVGRAGFESAHVRDARDVLALDLDCCARLTREPRDGFCVGQRLGQHELDRHLLVQLQVARGDHDAHSPNTQHALDAVLAGQHLAFDDFLMHALAAGAPPSGTRVTPNASTALPFPRASRCNVLRAKNDYFRQTLTHS